MENQNKNLKNDQPQACVYCGEDLSNYLTLWRICPACLVKESPRRKR